MDKIVKFMENFVEVDRRGSGRFVSFVDVFAPNNIVDYIKDHIREGMLFRTFLDHSSLLKEIIF